MTSTSRVCAGEIDWGMVHKTCCSLKLAHWPPWKKFGTTWTLLRGGRPANLSSHGTRALVRQGTETWWSRWQSSSRTLQRTTISAALRELGLHGKVTWQKWLCKRWKTPGVPKKAPEGLGKILWSDQTKTELECQVSNREPPKHRVAVGPSVVVQAASNTPGILSQCTTFSYVHSIISAIGLHKSADICESL